MVINGLYACAVASLVKFRVLLTVAGAYMDARCHDVHVSTQLSK